MLIIYQNCRPGEGKKWDIKVETNVIRKATSKDYPFLKEMLYESIHVPPGHDKPPLSIIELPELNYYIRNWMKASDVGVIAEYEGYKVGAAWARLAESQNLTGYGFIDLATPELCFAVRQTYRNRGLGTVLMEALFGALKEKGYEKISLSVSKTNRAVKLYRRLGFELLKEQENDFLMVKRLIRSEADLY